MYCTKCILSALINTASEVTASEVTTEGGIEMRLLLLLLLTEVHASW